ncbi:MAG: matrixin family metalloprotease [Gammaproteobacteria bacterium]|nr:matrixin family metalloprotease [Gammaproteobacteria bacterium]
MTLKRLFANAFTGVGLVAVLLLLTLVAGHSYVSSGRWDAGDIPVRIHLGNLSTAWRPAAIDGLRAWNDAGSRFSFSWSPTSRAPAQCERYDATNSVIWSDAQCSLGARLDWDDGLLAKTHFWTLRSTGAIVDADVMFNNAKRWSIYNGRLRKSRGDTVWDFRRVATHEFGHVLGLDHPDDHGQVRTALMNSETSDIDTLQPDDVNGIRDLYGSDPGRGSPDLVVRSLRVDDSTLTPEQVFSLSATIANEGTGTSAATTLRYYYWRASARAWTVVGFDSVTSLSPSASADELIRLRAPSTAGRHYYTACVQAVTGETNRRNCARSSVRVTVSDDDGGAPDLVVQNPVVSSSSVVVGQDFTFTATVRNVGTATAAATTVRYYSRAEGGSWMRIGSSSVRSLAPAATSPVSAALRAPSTAGTYLYTACVASVAGETNTRNCAGNVQIAVSPDDEDEPDEPDEPNELICIPSVIYPGETRHDETWASYCRARYYHFVLSAHEKTIIDLTAEAHPSLRLNLYRAERRMMELSSDLCGGGDAEGNRMRIDDNLAAGAYVIEAADRRRYSVGEERLFSIATWVERPGPCGIGSAEGVAVTKECRRGNRWWGSGPVQELFLCWDYDEVIDLIVHDYYDGYDLREIGTADYQRNTGTVVEGATLWRTGYKMERYDRDIREKLSNVACR